MKPNSCNIVVTPCHRIHSRTLPSTPNALPGSVQTSYSTLKSTLTTTMTLQIARTQGIWRPLDPEKKLPPAPRRTVEQFARQRGEKSSTTESMYVLTIIIRTDGSFHMNLLAWANFWTEIQQNIRDDTDKRGVILPTEPAPMVFRHYAPVAFDQRRTRLTLNGCYDDLVFAFPAFATLKEPRRVACQGRKRAI